MNRYPERVGRASASVRAVCTKDVEIALILGSGLADMLTQFAVETTIPYSDIDAFPGVSAPGHQGNLLVGTLNGRRVAAFQGRFHLYEGHSAGGVTLPVYLVRSLGARSLVVTNAAGALNPAFRPGEPMLIADHMNFTGKNPLTGLNDEQLGVRFPDMSQAYSPELRRLAIDAAQTLGETLHTGIYAAVTGPSLETSAERRFFRRAGADAIGMSTVMEVIAANHCGLDVLGISAIANVATGDEDQQPDRIEDVLHNASIAGQSISKLLDLVIPDM
ncbi:MAG: purine-nucleoside phosphorylase [Woeseia sp.]